MEAISALGPVLRLAFAADADPLPEAFQQLLKKIGAESARAGSSLDEAKFSRQLTALVPTLRSFARSLCRDSSLADDLAQEAVLKAWTARDRFQPDTNLRAWCFVILRNIFLSHMRRQKFTAAWDERAAELRLVSRPTQEEQLHVEDVDRLLARIPQHQRQALLMVEAEDMKYEEVSVACGVPVGTVKSRVCRARKAIVDALGESDELAA